MAEYLSKCHSNLCSWLVNPLEYRQFHPSCEWDFPRSQAALWWPNIIRTSSSPLGTAELEMNGHAHAAAVRKAERLWKELNKDDNDNCDIESDRSGEDSFELEKAFTFCEFDQNKDDFDESDYLDAWKPLRPLPKIIPPKKSPFMTLKVNSSRRLLNSSKRSVRMASSFRSRLKENEVEDKDEELDSCAKDYLNP